MEQLEVGNKVRYGSNGSIGVVEEKRTDGPFADNHAYYVRWHYGLDSRGEQVTEVSAFFGIFDRYALVPISDERFEKHITRRFNSGACLCGCMERTQ